MTCKLTAGNPRPKKRMSALNDLVVTITWPIITPSGREVPGVPGPMRTGLCINASQKPQCSDICVFGEPRVSGTPSRTHTHLALPLLSHINPCRGQGKWGRVSCGNWSEQKPKWLFHWSASWSSLVQHLISLLFLFPSFHASCHSLLHWKRLFVVKVSKTSNSTAEKILVTRKKLAGGCGWLGRGQWG